MNFVTIGHTQDNYSSNLQMADQSTIHVIGRGGINPDLETIGENEIDMGPGTVSPDFSSTSTALTIVVDPQTVLFTNRVVVTGGTNTLNLNSGVVGTPGQMTIDSIQQAFDLNTGTFDDAQINFTGTGVFTIPNQFNSSHFSGPVTIGERTMVNATGSTPFGSQASVEVMQGGALRFGVDQTLSSAPVHVDADGALGGDLIGAIYSGPHQNITLDPDAIFFNVDGPLPVLGVDVASPIYLMGITDSAQNVNLSQPGSIFHGVAFGLYYTPGGAFSGSVTEVSPGAGIPVYNNTFSQVLDGATFNTTNTTTGVTFTGPGEIVLVSPTKGTARVFTATGDPQGSTGSTIFEIDNSHTLPSGRTLNVSNGALYVQQPDAVDNGAVVNIGNGGAFQPGDPNNAISPTSGTYNIAAGGAVYLTHSLDRLDQGATFNFAPRSAVVFSPDAGFGTVDTGTPSWIPPTADIVVEGDLNDSSAIVLGDESRITTSSSNTSAGSVLAPQISAAPGASHVLLTAATGSTLNVNTHLSLAGVDLQIGDATVVTGFSSGTQRRFIQQTGTVFLGPTTDGSGNPLTDTVRDLTVDAGVLNAFTNLSMRNFFYNSTNSSLLTGALSFSGSISVNAGQVIIANFSNGTIAYGPGSSVTVNNGTLNYNENTPPVLPATPFTFTIGGNGSIDTFSAGDPFSDTSGHRAAIVNDGGIFTGTGTSSHPSSITGVGLILMFGGTITTDVIKQNTVELQSGAAIVLNAGRRGSVIPTLQFDAPGTARFDVNDDALIVPYSSTTPIDMIRQLIAEGYNGGAWNGFGIASLAAANDASHKTALGYADAADVGLTSVDGAAIAGNAVVVRYTYYGDSSLDGKVDLGNDFNLFLQGFLGKGSGWEFGDYNYDGVVNVADFKMFIDGFKAQGGSLGELDAAVLADGLLSNAQRATLLAAVPEPSCAAIMAVGAWGLLSRKRRRGQ